MPRSSMLRVPARLLALVALTCGGSAGLAGLAAGSATAGSAASPTCGGEAPIKTNGVAWQCTFDDEFDGTALDRSAWTVQTTASYGFHSGSECMVDSPNNISVAGGYLNLTVRAEAAPFVCTDPKGNYLTSWTAGSIYTTAFAQQYGRFEIRARFAEGSGQRGVQGSLWLFAQHITPTTLLAGPTEIDVAEAYSRYPDLVMPSVHAFTSSLFDTTNCSVPDAGAAFHTYAVEWTPQTITFSYDGAPCYRVGTPPSFLPAPNPFLISLTQALGVTGNRDDAGAPLPATLQVDYVRVWK